MGKKHLHSNILATTQKLFGIRLIRFFSQAKSSLIFVSNLLYPKYEYRCLKAEASTSQMSLCVAQDLVALNV